MKDVLLSILRDKDISRATYRDVSHKLGCILAAEVAAHLDRESFEVATPLSKGEGFRFKNDIVLIPILRSGIVLLEPFMSFFPGSKVGFVGLRRDEKTAIPMLYYQNLPVIAPENDVLVLDPMIATGGSGSEAVKILIKAGIKEEKIIFVGVIAAPEGIEKLKSLFPKMTIVGPVVDEKLNDKKFIVPGLGDFGDRYFGTE
jgi:uracil phosphoribosyltransferase